MANFRCRASRRQCKDHCRKQDLEYIKTCASPIYDLRLSALSKRLDEVESRVDKLRRDGEDEKINGLNIAMTKLERRVEAGEGKKNSGRKKILRGGGNEKPQEEALRRLITKVKADTERDAALAAEATRAQVQALEAELKRQAAAAERDRAALASALSGIQALKSAPRQVPAAASQDGSLTSAFDKRLSACSRPKQRRRLLRAAAAAAVSDGA